MATLVKRSGTANLWTHLAAAVAFLIPVALMTSLSYYQALGQQRNRAQTLAGAVLQREQAVSEQVERVRAALTSVQGVPPCSPASIEHMRDLALGASYLQAVGYVEENRLLCSSYGAHEGGIQIGPADYLNARHAWIRRAVELPIGTHQKFVLDTDAKTGFSGIVLPDVLLDAARGNPDVSIGLVGVSTPAVLASHGDFDPSHVPQANANQLAVTWDEPAGVGVVERSSKYDYAGMAFIPATSIFRAWMNASVTQVPIGVMLGLALWVLTYFGIQQRMSLLASLKRAIRRNELYLTYMPVVELASGRPVGAEALLRWRRPLGEMVGPDTFIPLAEQNHLIGRVTEKMFEIFAKDARRFLTGYPDVYVSLNLSGHDFADPAIVKKLTSTQRAAGLPNLMVEATEGALLNLDKARHTIGQFRDLGVRVAIDDFGTGYSNLSYLGSLDVDCLKIDRSFVSAIGTGSVRSAVVEHIIAMARHAGLTIVAEGVETQAQADHLRAAGVTYAQGWLFGKPMPAEQFADLLLETQVARNEPIAT